MKYAIIIFISIFLLPRCNKSEEITNGSSSFRIDAGFACGWGAGADSLIITSSSVKYKYWIPRESSQPVISKSRSVSDTEWISIVNSVNLDDFQRLNYNSCAICVDGCDEWIAVRTDQLSHQIRFGKGVKIDTISDLQKKLEQLRSEFNK